MQATQAQDNELVNIGHFNGVPPSIQPQAFSTPKQRASWTNKDEVELLFGAYRSLGQRKRGSHWTIQPFPCPRNPNRVARIIGCPISRDDLQAAFDAIGCNYMIGQLENHYIVYLRTESNLNLSHSSH